jgi:hypothetical protein
MPWYNWCLTFIYERIVKELLLHYEEGDYCNIQEYNTSNEPPETACISREIIQRRYLIIFNVETVLLWLIDVVVNLNSFLRADESFLNPTHKIIALIFIVRILHAWFGRALGYRLANTRITTTKLRL